MDASMLGIALKMTVALGVVLLVFGISIYAARKLSLFSGARRGKNALKRSEIDIVGQRSIAPGKQLMIVSIEGKRFLIGTTQQNISKLADLEDDIDDAEDLTSNFSDSLNESDNQSESIGSQIRSRLGAITRV